MVATRQLILLVVVVAWGGVKALAEDDGLLQQMTLSQGEDDLPLPQEPVEEGTEGQEDVGDTPGDQLDRLTAAAAGETLVPGDDDMTPGVEPLDTTTTPSSVEELQSRGDVKGSIVEVGVKTSGVPRCEQEMESGMCRAYLPSWYFDPASATCQEFIYGGCGGNDNNFHSKEHCQAACPDVVLCPEDPSRMCIVSESACMTATCLDRLEYVCRVTPCTCDIQFVDYEGQPVSCDEPAGHNTTSSGDELAGPFTTPSDDEPAGLTITPGDDGDDDDDDHDEGAHHGEPEDKEGSDTSGSWITPTLVAVGIVALVASVTAAWVVGRRWRRQAGSGYISASSGKPSQYPQTVSQMPDQNTDGSLSV